LDDPSDTQEDGYSNATPFEEYVAVDGSSRGASLPEEQAQRKSTSDNEARVTIFRFR
jgi:hypothetical protein